jgi:hypothetical protein
MDEMADIMFFFLDAVNKFQRPSVFLDLGLMG